MCATCQILIAMIHYEGCCSDWVAVRSGLRWRRWCRWLEMMLVIRKKRDEWQRRRFGGSALEINLIVINVGKCRFNCNWKRYTRDGGRATKSFRLYLAGHDRGPSVRVCVLKIKLHVIKNSKKGTCCTALHDEEWTHQVERKWNEILCTRSKIIVNTRSKPWSSILFPNIDCASLSHIRILL